MFQRTLENIETDAAELVNIGVVNLGQESDLRRCHRVIIWEEQLQLEDTACVDVRLWGVCGLRGRISPS